MEKQYQKLAESFERSTFDFMDKKVVGNTNHVNSIIHISVYNLNIEYKNTNIEIRNELGNHNLGKINCILPSNKIPPFKITTNNHFYNLFFKKKTLFKVRCENENFKSNLEQFLVNSGMNEIAKESSFQPTIQLIYKDKQAFLQTDYHLEFDDKIGALHALIYFYQNLIDV